MEHMEQVGLMLGGLRQSARQWEQARDELDDQLVATVDAGATFEQIAQSLGLKSRQAAHRRYVAAIGRMDRDQRGEQRIARRVWGTGDE